VPGDPNCDSAAKEDRSSEVETALIEAIKVAWNTGAPLSEQPRAKDRYAPGIVSKVLHCATETVAGVLARLMSEGAIERALFNAKTKSFGLRIVPFDERDLRGAGRNQDSAEECE
jgi:hypothetical protein